MKAMVAAALVSCLAWAQVRAQSLADAIALQFNQPDSAIALAEGMLSDARGDVKLTSDLWEVIGIAHWVKGQNREAFRAHSVALGLRQRLGYDSGIGYSINNLGLALAGMNDWEAALEKYLLAMGMAEEHADTAVQVRVLGNIGTLYDEQGDHGNAIRFHKQALELIEKAPTSLRIHANTLNNIALSYWRMKEPKTSLDFWERCLRMREKEGNLRGLALARNNMALAYDGLGHRGAADSLYRLALNGFRELGDDYGLAMALGNLGSNALAAGDARQAVRLCLESYKRAADAEERPFSRSACKCLSDAYDAIGNLREANRWLREYAALTDSIRTSDAGRKLALMHERHEHAKEQLREEAERNKERLLAEAEIARQLLLRNAAVAIGMMGLLLFFILYSSYRNKQTDNELLAQRNEEISSQKEEIAEKSREITDSIVYAKRLQDARLPLPQAFDRCFSGWHVLFRPKDIVSGDFYWLEEADGTVFLAVADCTGHGVPGAMVSMVGIHGLHRAIIEQGLRSPAAILTELSAQVMTAFEKAGGSIHDGMDIALIAIDKRLNSVLFSGANNSLAIISTEREKVGAKLLHAEDGLHLHEVKGARRAIGGHPSSVAFTDTVVGLAQGDMLALMSDGLQDQFGGPDDRKFSSRRVRESLMGAVRLSDFSVIGQALDNWKGDGAQTDDVTVVLVRP